MFDLTKWFVMPKAADNTPIHGIQFGRDTHHLEGINLITKAKVYAYHYDNGKTMVFAKTPQKWPWDVKPYDNNFIYDGGTELDWKSMSNFKRMNAPIPLAPRFWDGNPIRKLFSQHIAYQEFTNCSPTGKGDVGPGWFTIESPFAMDFQGDVGLQTTIRIFYYWGNGKHREELCLTNSFGWVRWSHSLFTVISSPDTKGGPGLSDYVIDTEVIHNILKPGGLDSPAMPNCYPI